MLEDNGHQIKVRWPNLGNYSVSVTEKNYIQAVSDTIQHLVQVTSVQAVANLEVTQIDDSTFLFTDQSVNANFILLDFGDGSSAEILLPGDSILHTYNGSGDFVVSLWAANQCTEAQDSATISITEINGILQSSLFDGISIFPSPAKEWVQIDGVSPKYGELKLQVFSAKGKLWKTLSLNRNMKIAVSDWPIGTYFFRVEMAGHSKLFPTVIAN